jgi:hypothetical protein
MSIKRFSGALASEVSVFVTILPLGTLAFGAGAMRRIARPTSTKTSDSSMISLVSSAGGLSKS